MATSLWKGHITFGLISLPVRLQAAARPETVSFNQLTKGTHSRVKQQLVSALDGTVVSRSELVKGYEYEKDKYVVIEDEDIKKIQPKTAKVMEILEFVPANEVDSIYLESSYYLHPEEAGEKAYTLLFQAMKETGHYGIARLTMHNREHIVVLRPGRFGMVLHTMYYQDEIRALDEFRTDTGNAKEIEVKMATQLVQGLSAHFDPEKYKDTYRETLKGMIEAKIAGKEVVAPPQAQELAPVVDIMEALKSSLAALKKPVVSIDSGTAAPAEEEKPKRRKAGGA
jgi:DNA end-binding protein Ku